MVLGEFLKGARTSAGLSVEELAERTSLRMGLLKDMENNNFLACGGDTYARGHLRNIAPKIFVNPQTLLDLYDEEHSRSSRKLHEMLVESNIIKIPRERKTISWKYLAVVSVVILAAVVLGQIVISNSKTTIIPVIRQSPTSVAGASPPVSEATPISTVAPGISAELSLIISAARGNSNIDVVVGGKHLYKGPLFQGDSQTFRAPTSISIYLSNAGDLDLTLNGEKLSALGARNQEVRKTFRTK